MEDRVGVCPKCDGEVVRVYAEGETSYECLTCGRLTTTLPEAESKATILRPVFIQPAPTKGAAS